MKKLTMFTFFYVVVTISLLIFSTNSSAKKRCKPLLEKLHNVQMMQRKNYSLKRGQSLRAKEDKARDKWWQCENSSLSAFKSKYGTKKKKAKKKQKSTTHYAKLNKVKLKLPKKMATFNQDSAIVIKSKYHGDKKLAWLQFYQQPIKCQRPKNINVFAFCSEDKLQQRETFEHKYIQ
ncbi:hypothetical protein CXF79_20135 [Colwellia sp. Bg11-28]|uniref:Uncharacterized protein n=2 Tax=Colwelliaceae TaxID=267889 RepID=Q47VX0_COLP3|nr:hypothetical protein CPS_4403 [Colwellia psychrerythraea 34H]PKH86173.1 hypothetical protein CXF79_20135 [Colwellia sp. Bg11-28]